jgi:hypothetical protein
MPLNLVQLKPGVVKDITEYASGKNGPFWTDGNNVRFRNGYATKIGGWENEEIFSIDVANNVTSTASSTTGVPRKLNFWRATSDGVDYLAVGTHNHLHVIKDSGVYDITPLISTASLTNPFTTADGSAEITVADTSHGQLNGDWVQFSGASAVNGVAADTLNQKAGYQITYVDANSYKITTADTASGAGAGGGSVTANYLIGAEEGMGSQTAAPALGWGSGGWGEEAWGTPRTVATTGVVLEQTNWSLNLWGEDLIAVVRGGQIYYWDTSSGVANRAVLVSSLAGAENVPTANRVSFVSFPDRHLVCAGSNPLGSSTIDPMLVRWSDQENFLDWTPKVENTSGDQRLEIGTKIVAAMPTRDEIFISTDEAVYGMAFIGPPLTFSFRLVGVNCGAVGINTMINVDGDVYWMGKSDFFLYNGSVQEIPCPVQFYVFDRTQKDFFDKNFAAHNKEFNEVIWFYVSTDNTATDGNPEPDSYVTYNYRDNCWSIGTIPRTCWFDSFGFRKNPFAFSSSGLLYNHEVGTDDDGSAISAHITSSPIEIDSGGNTMMLVDKIIPDATVSGSLSCTVTSKKYPNDSAVTKGPFTIQSNTDKISMRSRGRQMSLKLESTATGDSWSLGDFRINSRQDGLR